MKIISSAFFAETSGLFMQSSSLFHTCGNLMLLYKYFAVKCKVRRQTAAVPLFCHCHHLAIVAANGEITKVMVSEKEETMKNRL